MTCCQHTGCPHGMGLRGLRWEDPREAAGFAATLGLSPLERVGLGQCLWPPPSQGAWGALRATALGAVAAGGGGWQGALGAGGPLTICCLPSVGQARGHVLTGVLADMLPGLT